MNVLKMTLSRAEALTSSYFCEVNSTQFASKTREVVSVDSAVHGNWDTVNLRALIRSSKLFRRKQQEKLSCWCTSQPTFGFSVTPKMKLIIQLLEWLSIPSKFFRGFTLFHTNSPWACSRLPNYEVVLIVQSFYILFGLNTTFISISQASQMNSTFGKGSCKPQACAFRTNIVTFKTDCRHRLL